MPTQKEKADLQRARLKKAFALARAGEYQKARYLVRNMEHPKAKELLAVLEGKRDTVKRKPATNRFAIFMTIFVIVAVLGSIGGLLFFQSYMSQFSLADLAGFSVDANEDTFLYFDVVSNCYYATNYESESCFDWTESVMDEHQEQILACFDPYDPAKIYSEDDYVRIGNCFGTSGIPSPY